MSRRELKALIAASKQIPPPVTSKRRCFRVDTCLSTREMDGEQGRETEFVSDLDGEQVRETEFDVGDNSEQQANMEATVSELQAMVEHLTEEVRSKDARIDLLENKLLHVRAEAEAKLQCSQKQMEEMKMIVESSTVFGEFATREFVSSET